MEARFVETCRVEYKFKQDVVYDSNVSCDHVLVLVFELDARQHQQNVILSDLAHSKNHWILCISAFREVKRHQMFESQKRDEILVSSRTLSYQNQPNQLIRTLLNLPLV